MQKVVLFISTSFDGFIADLEGNIDWLKSYKVKDYGYGKFLDEIDAAVMGSHTYEQITESDDWPYEGIKTYVYSVRNLSLPRNEKVEIHDSIDPDQIPEENVWLVGGSKLIESYFQQRLIDEIHLIIVPTKLINGIPLFLNEKRKEQLELLKKEKHENNVIKLVYQVKYPKVSIESL